MLAATAAEFLHLQPVLCRLPILGLGIVSFLAIAALHRNDLSGHKTAPDSLTENRELKTKNWFSKIPANPAELRSADDRGRSSPHLAFPTARSPRSSRRLPCGRLRGWQTAGPFPSRPA